MSKQKRLPAEERKRVILRAAIEVFSESNYRVAKVSEIAARAGVTDPMIYKFFTSKKELFVEVLTITNRKTLEKFGIQNFLTDKLINNAEPIREAIEKSLLAYFSSMEKYQKELKVFYQAISEIDDPDIQNVIRSTYKGLANSLEPILQHATDIGILSGQLDAKTIAWDIVGFTIQQNALFLADLYNEKHAKALLKERIKSWIG